MVEKFGLYRNDLRQYHGGVDFKYTGFYYLEDLYEIDFDKLDSVFKGDYKNPIKVIKTHLVKYNKENFKNLEGVIFTNYDDRLEGKILMKLTFSSSVFNHKYIAQNFRKLIEDIKYQLIPELNNIRIENYERKIRELSK